MPPRETLLFSLSASCGVGPAPLGGLCGQGPAQGPRRAGGPPAGLLLLMGHFHFLMQEDKTRLLKERLDQVYSVNERRCSRAPVYGTDLLAVCSLACRERGSGLGALGRRPGKGARPASVYTSASHSQRDLILTLTQRQESLQDVIDR